MIFVTGDCHGEFQKLSTAAFPEQREMTKDDIVIICGDFGAIWDCDGVSNAEKYWLNWLDEKPFTTVIGLTKSPLPQSLLTAITRTLIV